MIVPFVNPNDTDFPLDVAKFFESEGRQRFVRKRVTW
jgi:hypothetical protein